MDVLIPLLVFAPAVGALSQVLNPRPIFCRTVALVATFVSMIAAIALFASIDGNPGGLSPSYSLSWIQSYSIHFALGVDGLNLLPVLVTAIVFPILIVSEWERQFGRRGIHALLLLSETAILGALCSQDLFLLLFFFLMIPAPLYFLSSIWGDEGRETAAFRMISVSLVAGAALLFGALLIYHAVDPHTFLIDGLRGRLTGKTANLFGMEFALNQLAFGLIVLGLALRAPVWPVHGWFRKLILKVPTTVGIAAILGGFPVAITVFTRLGLELFPETISANSDIWVVAGMANLAFGMFSLLQEKDLRGIVVSLSTSFVGLSLLGVGTGHPTGFVGSQFVLFSSVMALSVFGFAAEILRSRVRTYRIDELNGVLRSLPDLGTATLISFASAIGLPGTVGFVAFILLMVGMFNGHASIVLASLGAMVAIGAFMIHTYRMIFLGERQADRFPSLSFRERFLLFPLVVAVVAVGVFPSPLVEIVRNTVVRMLATGATE